MPRSRPLTVVSRAEVDTSDFDAFLAERARHRVRRCWVCKLAETRPEVIAKVVALKAQGIGVKVLADYLQTVHGQTEASGSRLQHHFDHTSQP